MGGNDEVDGFGVLGAYTALSAAGICNRVNALNASNALMH